MSHLKRTSHLGRPAQTLASKEEKQEQATPPSTTILPRTSGRDGDNGFGRPPQRPTFDNHSGESFGKVSKRLQEQEGGQSEDIYSKPITIPLGWLSAIWLAGMLFVGLIGLFVFSQLVSTIQSVSQFPLWLQIPAWGLLGFFVFVVSYPLVRMLTHFRKLPKTRQIHVQYRRNIHSDAQLHYARDQLTLYLRKYNLEKGDFDLEKHGTIDSELKVAREALLSTNRAITSGEWVNQFDYTFLKPLDMCAETRVEHYARMVAMKTAISPNPLIDMAVVLDNGFSLLGEICSLYHVRAGRIEMVILFGLVLAQSYLSGQVQENLDIGDEALNSVASNALGATVGNIAGGLSTRTVKAALHYLLMRRIGRFMQKRLRPLSIAKK
jgi:uncharacterized membrane protein YcjF (UPF0283 family)